MSLDNWCPRFRYDLETKSFFLETSALESNKNHPTIVDTSKIILFLMLYNNAECSPQIGTCTEPATENAEVIDALIE